MSLTRIEKWCCVAAVIMVLVSIPWRSVTLSISLVAGAALSFASFMMLRVFVGRAMRGGGATKTFFIAAVSLKLVLVGAALWFIIAYVPVQVIPFMIGLSAVFVAILVETVYVHFLVRHG